MVIPKPKQLPSGNWNVRLQLKDQFISRTFNCEEAAIDWARSYKETIRKTQNKLDQYEALLLGITKDQEKKPLIERRHLPTIAEELALIDKMDGIAFEKYCMNLIMLTGCFKGGKFHLTKATSDYGADIIIECIDRTKIAIQCKRIASNVKIDAIQEVAASKLHYDANVAAVITNSYFTKQAQILAQENGIALINRNSLMKLIQLKIEALDELYNQSQWESFLTKMEMVSIKKGKQKSDG